MKRYALVKAAVLGVLSCVSALAFGQFKSNRALDGCRQQILVEPVEGISKDFIRGVDISSLAAVEENRGRFLNKKGEEEDIFKILKDNGVNWVRLRVWNKRRRKQQRGSRYPYGTSCKKSRNEASGRLSLFRLLGRPCKTVYAGRLGWTE